MTKYKVIIGVEGELITFNCITAISSEEAGRKAMEAHLGLHDHTEESVILDIERK